MNANPLGMLTAEQRADLRERAAARAKARHLRDRQLSPRPPDGPGGEPMPVENAA